MIRNSIVIKLISIVLLLPLSGCIAAIKGSEQKVSFTSKPEGALFTYYGKQCKAPCELILPRVGRTPSMLSIERDGYSPYSADIQPRPMSAAFVPIILFEACLILPVFIDLATGTWYDFPEEIHADFKAPLMAPMVDIKWEK